MDPYAMRPAKWCAPALFLAATTFGCATGGRDSYDSLRADVDRSADVDARTRVADDRALSGPELTRSTYVSAVLDRNPSIESARDAWRAAVARVRESGALEDPKVSFDVAPLSIGASSTRFGYVVAASQRVPWPGKLAFEEEVTKAEAQAAKSDFEGARRELALTAAVLYDEYFVAARSLEINDHHVALMRELKASALAQFEGGRGSAQDPLQAEAELAHMEHDAITLEADREITVAQMNELLHRDPEQPLPPPTKDLALSNPPASLEGKRLADEASASRPEIASARFHAQAEQARADRAERESYPDLTVSTSYNSMWDTPEHRWMVGLGLDVPIQFGRRAGAVDEANAARARFESEVASMTDQARTEVVVALKRLDEAHHVVEIFEDRLIPVARDQVDAARAGFIASRNDFAVVIGAEKNLRSVELDDQMARANVDRRNAELERARGRMPGIDGRDGAR
ncbi:MAG: TolC family protein, partial [Polyangiaceae bacterium]